MTILHLNDHLASVGGVETYLLSLVPFLEAEGHTVHVGYATGEDGLVENGHRLPELGKIRFRDVGTCRARVAALLSETGADVVHLHGIQNRGALEAAVDSGRAVLHGHDYRPVCPASNFFFKRTQSICRRTCGLGCFAMTARRHCMTPRPGPAAYFYRRVRWIAKHAERFGAVLAPSEEARDRFVAAGFRPEQVVTNPYFSPLGPREEPRSRPEEPTITFMGRASYTKGWEVFLAALGRLPATVRGLMVGNFDAAARSSIDALAVQEGCQDRLEVEGWAARGGVAGIYARTSVFIFPSLWPETLGIVGIEALSQGVPVVASAVGGVGEWLEDGVNGFAVPPKDPAAIAKAVVRILEGTGRNSLEEMGRNGIETIRQRFLPEHHLGKLLEVYRSVRTA